MALSGEELVRNGGFDEGEVAFGALPPAWSEQGRQPSSWGFANDDGIPDDSCIRVKLKNGAVTPLVQKLTCKPGTEYLLKAALKGEECQPVVTVTNACGQVVAQLKGDANGTVAWQEKSAPFTTGPKDTALTVAITAEGGKGQASVDAVSVSTPSASKAAGAVFKTDRENIALHKPYRFLTKARPYGLSRDAGDKVQLTDGEYTKGYFWTQKSTVGFAKCRTIGLEIDLGSVQPISGFSYNTAAGRAGVAWPTFINVYASEDGKSWMRVGDLLAKSCEERPLPPPDRYSVHRIASLDMPANGRYVSFVIEQSPYCFIDEIEVYRGDDSQVGKKLGFPSIEPMGDYKNTLLRMSLLKEVAKLEGALTPALAAKYQKELAVLKDAVQGTSLANIEEVPTIIPCCDVHRRLLALNARVLREKGFAKPMIWRNNRWDDLQAMAVPPTKAEPEPLVVDMMRGEVRAESFNILNPTDAELDCKVTVEGLPAGAGLDCRQVLFTHTRQTISVAGALKPGDGNSLSFKLEPGISRQVWLSFKRPTLPKGSYKAVAKVALDGRPSLQIPLTLNIYDLDFPKAPRLHVGGWDYLHGNADYYKAPGNTPANIAMMRDFYVDSPWAGGVVLPSGAEFDKEGHLVNRDKLDYSEWITWEERWKGARQWCLFANVKEEFQGERMGTPRFKVMVGEYYRAFYDFLKTRGIDASQLILLLVDEPRNHDYDKKIIEWGTPLKAAVPEAVFFEDPIYAKPAEAMPEMFEISDIICPNILKTVLQGNKPFYLDYQAKGKTLWLYCCSGPSRYLDPLAYHRGQMWHCFEMDAKGACYWAFGSAGGIGDSWHAFNQLSSEYSPHFVSQTDVMEAKQSEGIREGVQDYELLCLLKERAAAMKAAGKQADAVKAAERLLTDGVAEVLKSIAPRADAVYPGGWYWEEKKDRSVMDRVRIQALKLLEKLK